MKWVRLALLVLALGGAAGWLAWNRFRPLQVELTAPSRGPAVDAVYATGQVEPTLEIRIAPRVAGRLLALTVDEGDTVRAGQLLARLEDQDLRASVAELEAKIRYAQAQYDRNRTLRASGLIAQDPVDRSRSELEASEATLRRAREQLGFMRLVAPAAGRVIRREGEVGEFVPVNQVIFHIAGKAPLRINADVDEEDVPRVQRGQQVLVRTEAFPDRVFDGRVEEITPRGDPVSRSYRVRIALPGDPPLRIGMTAETNIVIAQRDGALLVPTGAVIDDAVWIVSGDRARRRAVRVGVRGPERVEILGGLADEDRIIASPPATLREGAKVGIRPAP
jgi:RND family efflux transporter MFP subunit